MKTLTTKLKGGLILIGLVILIGLPFTGARFVVAMITLFLMWAIVAISWNLLIGYAGIFAMGNLLFFAFGGYLSAWVALNLGISPFIGLLIGGCAAVAAGLAIGLPVLRLTGAYVALFTFASQELARNILLATPALGGFEGLYFIPAFSLGNISFELLSYYVASAVFLICTFTVYRLMHSRMGLVIVAIRESDTYASALGVDVHKYKVFVFAVAAFFTGVAGSFYAHYNTAFTPTQLSFTLLALVVTMVLIGGQGTIMGPIIGALVLTLLTESLRASLMGPVANIRWVLVGLMIPIVLIFRPSGLVGKRK